MNRRTDEQEPLLTAVARKRGQAAGTLANMTHLLTPDKTAKLSDSPTHSEPLPDAQQPSGKKVRGSANTAPKRRTKPRQISPKKPSRRASPGSRPQNTSASKKKAASRK